MTYNELREALARARDKRVRKASMMGDDVLGPADESWPRMLQSVDADLAIICNFIDEAVPQQGPVVYAAPQSKAECEAYGHNIARSRVLALLGKAHG